MTRMTRPDKATSSKIGEFHKALGELGPEFLKQWDSYLWSEAVARPGTFAKQQILRRIFITIKWGGLLFRAKESDRHWTRYSSTGWPIACALSHGGRIMIQLPRTRPGHKDEDHEFWNWLTNGQAGSSMIYKRSGTHATGNRDPITGLTDGRVKIIEELKGLKHGIAQMFRGLTSGETSRGQSYGMELALGGAMNKSFSTNMVITDNGDHGHLYFFYRPPLHDKYGGVLVGTEGEAPGHWGQSGNFHSPNVEWLDKKMNWRPSKLEGQFGEKWSEKGSSHKLGFLDTKKELIQGPDRYDSTLIDLTATGWHFLKDECEAHWDDSMVSKPAEAPRPIKEVPRHIERRDRLSEFDYLQIPHQALQLRLEWFQHQKSKRVTRTTDWRHDANKEYEELLTAIYGGGYMGLDMLF